MDIKVQPMGDYQTNCYIVTINDKDIIIDPGVNALSWLKGTVKKSYCCLKYSWAF